MSSKPTRPNILLLFTDDQRFDTIGALGNPAVETPNLDRLAARGTAFTNAHIMGGTSPAVCMPSRAMLHTGRTLFRIDDMGQEIPSEHTTLGEHLQANGYSCYGSGKWHNGRSAFARSFDCGAEIFFGGMFDHWNVPACDFDPSGEYASHLPRCPNPMQSNDVTWQGADHIQAGKHSTDLFADAAATHLGTVSADTPFFMYVSFMAPHDPRTMPQQFRDMYDPEDIDLPPNFMGAHPFNNGELHIRDEMLEEWPRTPEAIRTHIAEYYAMITHVDHAVGRILDALEASGRADDTIVVFAGDNGLAVGQHGLMGKQSLYDHSIRVPFMLAGPGIPEGEIRGAGCYLSDLFPTLCELAGITVPESVDGRSLLPVLTDADAAVCDTMYFAYRHLQRAVVKNDMKLIEYVVDGRRTTQLFDLQEDPWELTNLADEPEMADTVAMLREELLACREEYNDTRERESAFWQDYK